MKTLLGRFVLLGCLLREPAPALAQSYPNRTVTIVVTSAAGALTDVLTRAVSQRLSQMWGQTIVVENRGGAGHNFAATAVTRRRPTATRCSPPKPASSPASRISTPRASCPTTRRPTSSRSRATPAFRWRCWCNPSVPAKSVAELIALAKAEARHHDLRHRGRRHRAAHRRAAAGKPHRHQADGGALSRRRARAQRPDRRPHQHDHDGPVGRAAGRQGRQAQHAGLRQRAARARSSPTCRPSPRPFRATRRASRSACSRRPARRARSSSRSTPTCRRSSTIRSFASASSSRWWCSRCPARWTRSPNICARIRPNGPRSSGAANLKID